MGRTDGRIDYVPKDKTAKPSVLHTCHAHSGAGGSRLRASAGDDRVHRAVTTLIGTAATLNAGPGAQAWILSGTSVGAGADVLGSGAIGDDPGRWRTFVAGALVLALASLVGAVAPTGWSWCLHVSRKDSAARPSSPVASV